MPSFFFPVWEFSISPLHVLSTSASPSFHRERAWHAICASAVRIVLPYQESGSQTQTVAQRARKMALCRTEPMATENIQYMSASTYSHGTCSLRSTTNSEGENWNLFMFLSIFSPFNNTAICPHFSAGLLAHQSPLCLATCSAFLIYTLQKGCLLNPSPLQRCLPTLFNLKVTSSLLEKRKSVWSHFFHCLLRVGAQFGVMQAGAALGQTKPAVNLLLYCDYMILITFAKYLFTRLRAWLPVAAVLCWRNYLDEFPGIFRGLKTRVFSRIHCGVTWI